MRAKPLLSVLMIATMIAAAAYADPPKRSGKKEDATTKPAKDAETAKKNFGYLKKGQTIAEAEALFDATSKREENRSDTGILMLYGWQYRAGDAIGLYTIKLRFDAEGLLVRFNEKSDTGNPIR